MQAAYGRHVHHLSFNQFDATVFVEYAGLGQAVLIYDATPLADDGVLRLSQDGADGGGGHVASLCV